MINNKIIVEIVDAINHLSLNIRLKASFDEEPSSWESKAISSSDGYLELLKYGPVSLKEIQWVEIDSIKTEKVGRLIPDKKIDCKDDLLNLLNEKGISFNENHQFIKIKK